MRPRAGSASPLVSQWLIWAAIASADYAGLMRIDFWRALRFTLMFTFVTLPLVLTIGLGIALAVNNNSN